MNEIVVGVDPATTPDGVLDLALEEAARTGATVRAVRSVAPYPWATANSFGYPMTPLTVPDLADLRQVCLEELEVVVQKAQDRRLHPADLLVECAVLDGDAGRVLSDLSATASLTVVGGQRHRSVAHALLGSATSYVLHHAVGPVLVVPEGATGERLARVVVGLDGSEGSRAALVLALAYATAEGVPLVAVHVFDLSTSSVIGPWLDLPGFEQMRSAGLDFLAEELLRDAPGSAAVVECRSVPGPAAQALLAETRPNDLLVLGSRGRGGFAGLVLGSVATQCATHARGPVLVLRPRAPSPEAGPATPAPSP